MKLKFIITIVLFFIFTAAVSAQEKKTDQTENKTDSSTATKPQPKRIIGFANPEQMIDLLDGKWIFTDMTCAEPYTVTISSDRKSIKFQYAKPQKWDDGTEHDSFVYNVLELGKYYIRTQIDSEKRKSDDGKTVTWDFMFLSPNEFVWHRTDWQGLNSTTSVTRCDDGKKRTFTKTN